MANSINGAGASAGFVVSNSGAAPKNAGLRRHALLGSSALIGIAMTASPAFGQTTVNPTGGGAIVSTNGTANDQTAAGGGVRISNISGGSTVTVTGVTINQTVTGPTPNALSIEVPSGSGGLGVTFNGTNAISTTVSGGAAVAISNTANLGVGFLTSGSTFTGSYGLLINNPNGFISFNSQRQSFNIVANGTAVAGLSVAAQLNPEVYLGSSTISGFATGVNVTTTDPRQLFALVNSAGGSISATQVGINIAPAAASIGVVESQSAITAPIGIQVSGGNGATITTSGGGTINSTASGTGTGIIATGSSGTSNVTVTVGAAIGGTTGFGTGVNASTTGSSTGTVNVTTTGAINSTGTSTTDYGILASRTGASGNGTISVGANVTGGQGVYVDGGFDISVAAGATVTGVANGSASPSSTAYGVRHNSSLGSLMNAGTIRATGTNGIGFFNAGGITTTNMAGATISGTMFGIYNLNAGTLINAGTISSSAGTAYRAAGGTLTNTGTISGVVGVSINGNSLTVNNNAGGTITATTGAGILIASAGPFTSNVTNAGTITGGSGNQGINVSSGILALTNQSGGVISGGLGALNLGSIDSATIVLAAGSTTTGDILSSSTGARTLTVAGLLSGNYNATAGTGATTFTLNTGGSIQSVSMGNTAGTFTWNGGTVGGTLTGGNSLSTFNFNVGAGQIRALASIGNFFGNVQSGTLVLNGETGSVGAWRVLNGALLRVGSSFTHSGGTFASLQDAGGSLQIDAGATLTNSSNINVSAGSIATPITITVLGALNGTSAGGFVFMGGPIYAGAINNNGSGYLNVVNSGMITQSNSALTGAITHGGGTTNIANTGAIIGGTAGSTSTAYGIVSQGGTVNLTNTGTVSVVRGADSAILQANGIFNIANGGSISGTNAAIQTTAGNLTITSNTGNIVGSVNAINVTGGGAVSITNSVGGTIGTGTVTGGVFTAGGTTDALRLSTSGATTINNSGMIVGALAGISQTPGATGALTVINRAGTINGAANDGITTRGVFNAVNAQGATISSQVNSGIAVVGASSVTNGGALTGGTDATFGYGFQASSGSATTFNNFGAATGSQGGVVGLSSGAMAINLFAGSNTGNIVGGSGNDTLSLYNGVGTSNTGTSYVVATNTLAAGVPTDATRVLVQNAGTLAGATVGAINLGGGTNTLALRGTGDGTTANGAVGVLSASSIGGLSILNKLDSGTWNVTSGTLNYTGGTNVQGGRLVFVNRTIPAGTTTISSGAVLEFNLTGANYFQDGATFNGAGTFTKSGPALLANRSLISLASGGLIDVQGGILVGSSDAAGRFTGNLGSLNVASGATFVTSEAIVVVDRLTGTGTVGTANVGNFTVGVDNGTATFGGNIIDQNGTPGGKLVKVGTGTQTLTGANTYTGATTISGGTLAIGGTGTLGSSTITNNATFDIAGHTGGLSVLNLLGSGTTTLGANTLTLTNATGTYSGAFTGTGGLTKQGTGTYILTGAGNSYSGTTTVSGGTLQGSTASFSNASNIVDNATVAFVQAASGTFARTISGTGVVTVSGLTAGNTLTFGGALSNTGGLVISNMSSVTINAGAAGGILENGAGNRTLTIAGGSANNATGNTFGSGLFVQTSSGTTTVNVASGASLSSTAGSGNNRDGITALSVTAITNNGTISSTTNAGIALAGGGSINNFGTITGGNGGNGYGIAVSNGSAATVTLQSTSVVTGTQGGVSFQSTGTGGNSAQLSNAGQISSARYGIEKGGSGTPVITNLAGGQIVGGIRGILGAGLTITNSGLIGSGSLTGGMGAPTFTVGTGFAIDLSASADANMVTNEVGGVISGLRGIESAGILTLVNSGQISGTNDGTGVVVRAAGSSVTNNLGGTISGGEGVDFFGANGALTNAGSITSTSTVAVLFNGSGVGTITNSGSISGATYGIGAYGQSVTIDSSGTIGGSVAAMQLTGANNTVSLNAGSTTNGSVDAFFSTGANSFTLAGALNGGLTGGSGDDNVTLFTSGSVTGTITGGAGTDALVLDGTGTSSLNLGSVTGFESLTKNGTGTYTLSGTASGTMGWTINDGTLNADGGDALADLGLVTVNAAGTLGILRNETVGSLAGSGAVALGGTLKLGGDDTNSTFSGVASGNGGITKIGAGTFTLSGGNTFLGDVLISGGTLAYGADDVLADTVTVTVDGGAVFDLDGFSDTIGTLNLYGTLANGGLLTAGTYNAFAGSIIGQAISSGTLNVRGDTTLNAATTATPVNIIVGTLTTGAAELLANTGAVLIASGGQLTLGGAETIGSLGDLSGTGGIVDLAGFGLMVGGTNSDTTFSGVIQSSTLGGGLTKAGTGTLTLSGANTYTGATTIDGGTLALNGGSAIADTSAVVISIGGTLALLASETVGSIAGAGAISLDANTLTMGGDNSSTMFAGIASGSGGLTKTGTGTLTLTGANAYSGDTLIADGTLALTQSGSIAGSRVIANGIFDVSGTAGALGGSGTSQILSLAGSGSVVLGGTTLVISNADDDFAGVISGSGGVTLTAGNQTLSGDNIFTGTTTVDGGTLTLTGTNTGNTAIVLNGGVLSVASANNLGAIGSIGLLGGTLATTASFTTDRTIFTSSLTPVGGVDVANGTTFSVNGTLSGDGAIVKTGLGTLNLLADNSALTGDLFVNGGAVRAGNTQAFGTGTIHLVDPTLIYGVTGTYANNILLEVQTPASADPSTLRAEAGVFATISGSITQGAGIGVDPNQPLVIGGLGRIILANATNLWTGTTTINAGATLQGTSATISGSDTVANGLLLFSQPTSGTFAQNVSGSSNVQVTGLGSGETFTIGGALTNANGLQVLDVSALAITGSVTTTNNFTAVTLNLNNIAGVTSQLNNSGAISGVFALFARTNLDLINSGSISASVANFNNSGIFAGGNATVVNTGQITSGTNALYAQRTGNLTNSGLIRGGINASTIRFMGANSSITNLAAGVINTSGTGGGIFLDGTNASVINAGSITGGNALQLVAGGTVTNTGTLTSTVGSGVVFNATGMVDNQASGVIQGATNGVTYTAGSATITNAGSITGGNGSGLRLLGGGTVTNAASGQITGTGNAAILSQGGALNLVNRGSLTGTTGIAIAATGAFNNVIDLRAGSTTNGSITTDTGADTLTLNLGATLNGAVNGGAGTDSFIVTGAGSSTLAGNITNVESLAMNGSGTLTLSGANAGFATVAVNSGTLNATGGAAIDDAAAVTVASGATLGVLANETVGTLALAGTLAGTGTLTAAQYQLTGATVNANLGDGMLTQVSDVSTLNGTVAATLVAIDGGTLTLGASNRLADAANVAVASGATLDLGAFNDTVGTLALAGTLAGTGTLTAAQYQLTGATVNANLGTGNLFQLGGTSVLNGTAAAANVMVQGGILTLGASNRLADAANVAVATGATLNLGGNLDTVGILQLGGALGGTGTITAAQYQLTAATVNANLGTGTLFQLGGTSTLNGTAAPTTVVVNAGTLALGANERLADTAAVHLASGATFDLAGRTETIGSIGGTGTVALGAGRLVAGGTNADFGFGGNITGSGDVDKIGTGTFTLASNLDQTGRLNLNAGTTMFVGSTAGSVRVQGGTLTGSAAIAGNLAIASGSFSPGTAAQPIAMFTAGSFNASGGTLTFDLGGPATNFAADMVRVSGAAVLTGGTVFTRPIEPTANYRVSQNYVLLQSAALTGTFANGASFAPTGTNPDLQWRLRYDLLPNAVVLELRKQIDFTADLGPNASGNELAVGAALNGGAFVASDNWAGILNSISSQDPATRRATFNSISGEAISDISSATMIATSGFTDLLRQRLATGGSATGNANLLSGLVGGKQALVALAATAPLDGAALPTSYAEAAADRDAKRGGVWLQGFGANGRIDGLRGQAGIGTYSAGVAGGIDVAAGNFTIGGAFAASQVETTVRSRTSRSEGTLYQGGGYVAYDNGRLYGSVIGSYFSGDIDSRRSVFVGGALVGVATGTAKTRGYTAGAALGYRLPLSQHLLFTPQLSFTATDVTRGAFTETGAGGLSLQASRERRQLYAATAEGRLSRPFDALGGIVEPYVGGGAIYSFGDLDTVSVNRFTGAPIGTGSFSITGARLAPVTGLVNAGIDVRPTSNVRLGLQGEARLSQRQREERISLNLRIGF